MYPILHLFLVRVTVLRTLFCADYLSVRWIPCAQNDPFRGNGEVLRRVERAKNMGMAFAIPIFLCNNTLVDTMNCLNEFLCTIKAAFYL